LVAVLMGSAYSDGMSTADNTDRAFDPGPCPQCGQRNYRVNWIDVPTTEDLVAGPPYPAIPGTVTCLNPDCPSNRLEFPNELARRAARGLGASTHKPTADDPAPS
jgi:hypothetical protein